MADPDPAVDRDAGSASGGSRPTMPEAPASGHRLRGTTGLVAGLVLLSTLVGGISGAVTTALLLETGAVSSSEGRAGTAAGDVPAAIARVRQSVVAIDVVTTGVIGRRSVTQQGAGTGFVYSADGLIATNAHVIAGASQITVTLADGSVLPATVVGSDVSQDLALLRIQKDGLTPLRRGKSSELRVGQTVITVGNALELGASPSASLGIVSAVDRTITTNDGSTLRNLLQTDAAVNPGDSGGPLVDAEGSLLGVIVATSSTGENVGFAIPIDEALSVLGRLSAAGR